MASPRRAISASVVSCVSMQVLLPTYIRCHRYIYPILYASKTAITYPDRQRQNQKYPAGQPHPKEAKHPR